MSNFMLVGRSQTRGWASKETPYLKCVFCNFPLGVFFLSFVGVDTDAFEDLLRHSVFPCIYACVGKERKVPQEYTLIWCFLGGNNF